MSQSWDTILGSEYLKDTYPGINSNFETLRSNWSGTDFPSAPVAGQLFFRTTDKSFWIYDGSSWWQIGSASENFLSLLPRSGGDSYPMSGHLNMGGNRITNLAQPVDASNPGDAVNLAYLNQVINGHFHSGAQNDGPKIDVTNLNGNQKGVDGSITATDINGVATVATINIETLASETKLIVATGLATFSATDVPSANDFEVRRDSTSLIQEYFDIIANSPNKAYSFFWAGVDTPGAGAHEYKLIVNLQPTSSLRQRWLLVF